MGKDDELPFEVGQLIEARSFKSGYRSAWFRCKIKQISRSNGYMHHLLEYFDFPDEKETWTRLYQVRKKGEARRQLMVRPQYPPICHESLMPPINSGREVIVVITGSWSVGDLVDWWTDDCYWSGKLTKLLGNGKAEMELPPRPMGEGETYEVSFQNLRPSLNWSPVDGWSVPISVVGGRSHQCARLIYPVIDAAGDSSGIQMPFVGRTSDSHVEDHLPSAQTPMESLAAVDKNSGTGEMLEPSQLTEKTARNMNLVPEVSISDKTVQAEKSSSLHASLAALDKSSGTSKMPEEPPSSTGKTGRNRNLVPGLSVSQKSILAEKNSSSNVLLAALDKTSGTSEMLEEPLSLTGSAGRNMKFVPQVSVFEKKILAEKNSSLHDRDGSAKTVGDIVEEDLSNPSALKKLRTSGGNSFNSLKSGTIEDTFLALEELLNKIKQLKAHFGVSPPNDLQHSWKFVEHHAPSMQK